MRYGVERSTTLGGSNKLCSHDEDLNAWCIFLTLQHSDQRPSLPPLQLIPCKMNHRSSLVVPYLKHRSHYSQVFRVVAIAYIAVAGSDFWRRILGAPPTPGPLPLTLSPYLCLRFARHHHSSPHIDMIP